MATEESEHPSTTTLECEDCGRPPLTEDAEFCGWCGGGLTVSALPDEDPPQADDTPADPPRTAAAVDGVDELDLLATSAIEPPRRSLSRRALVVGAGGVVAVGVGVAVAVVASGGWLIGSSRQPAATSSPSGSPSPAFRTLPGWSNTALWSTTGVVVAAGSPDGRRLAFLNYRGVVILDAHTGEQIAQHDLVGSAAGVRAAQVSGRSALAAFTSREVLVWIGDDTDPIRIDLAGRDLQPRGTGLFLRDTNGSYMMVTANGPVPALPLRPGMRPLAVTAQDAVLWASQRGTVTTVALNGVAIAETPLAPSEPGATIANWLMPLRTEHTTGSVASDTTVVVQWKGTAERTITAVHNNLDGSIIATTGDVHRAFLNDSGTAAVVNDILLDLTAGTTTTVPEQFQPGLFVGDALYGATQDGAIALMTPGSDVLPVPAPSTSPVAVNRHGDLITLVGERLQAFAPTTPKEKK